MVLTDIVLFQSDIGDPVLNIPLGGGLGNITDQVTARSINELTLVYEFSFGF